MINALRPYLSAVQLIMLGLILAFLAFKMNEAAKLKSWRADVLVAISQVNDVKDRKGRLVPVKAKEAVAVINSLGRFKLDVAIIREAARADDLANKITVEDETEAKTKEITDDFRTKKAAILDRANGLASSQPARSVQRQECSATPTHSGGGGATHLPALPGLSGRADEASSADGLSLAERVECSLGITQLDSLISAVEAAKQVHDRQGRESEGVSQ